MSSQQYFSYIQDQNKFNKIKKTYKEMREAMDNQGNDFWLPTRVDRYGRKI